MATTQDQPENVSSEAPKKRPRSPAYPSIDLSNALEKAELIRKNAGKNPINVDIVLTECWGGKAKSGGGMTALSALIKFGLLEDEGKGDERRVHLTPLATQILLDDRPESPERLAAIREAALKPSIYKELWEKYQGALPIDATLRVYLRRDRGFQDEGAKSCIETLRSTLAYARLPESANISPKAEDKTQPEGEVKMTPPPTMTAGVPVKGKEEEQKPPADQGVTPTMRVFHIPLTNAPWAMIQVPYPMKANDWEELMDWFRLFKSNASALTKGAVKATKAEEAKQT